MRSRVTCSCGKCKCGLGTRLIIAVVVTDFDRSALMAGTKIQTSSPERDCGKVEQESSGSTYGIHPHTCSMCYNLPRPPSTIPCCGVEEVCTAIGIHRRQCRARGGNHAR